MSTKQEIIGSLGEKQLLLPDLVRAFMRGLNSITARGGRTAHAAVVARQMGKVCLVGCRELAIDLGKRGCSIGGKVLREGQVISLDGGGGGVYTGAVEIVRAKPESHLAAVASWRAKSPAPRTPPASRRRR